MFREVRIKATKSYPDQERKGVETGFNQVGILIFLTLLLGRILAPASGPPGPDTFGYTVQPTTNYSFVQITNVLQGSQRVLWFDDDTAFTVANIGFTFRFYGTNYTSVSFNVNGLVTFGGQSQDPANVNLTSASPTNNQPCIAVLWDDWETLYYGNEDAVYYRTMGTVGNRQFVVQWNKVDPIYGPGIDPVIFQVRLFEGSHRILFSYLDAEVSDDATNYIASFGAGATVGIRTTSGQSNGRSLQWSFNQPVITNGLNLLFLPTNSLPVATNDATFTPEDTPVVVGVLSNDRDNDGDVLSVASVTPGANGAATINLNGTITYLPGTNFNGADQFSYVAADGRGGSSTGLVSVVVSPVNDPPLAIADNAATAEDTPVTIDPLINDTDVEGDPITLVGATSADGVVSVLGGTNLIFLPNTNLTGTAFITYTNSDGLGGPGWGTVTVTVNPVNDAPYAYDDFGTTPQNTSVLLAPLTNDFDVDGDSLILLDASATNGVVSLAGLTNLLFTPDTNFYGLATITYTNSDGFGGEAWATVTVTVNDPPQIADLLDQSGDEDTVIGPLNFTVEDSESVADVLTLAVTSSNLALVPINGIMFGGSGTNRTVTITPATNQFGTTLVTVTVTDPDGGTASDSLLVTINPVNDPPVILEIASRTNHQDTVIGPIAITIADLDSPAESLVLTAESTNTLLLPTNNIVFGGGGINRTITLTPETNQFGLTLITVTVADGDGATNASSFLLTINALPAISLISDQSTNEDNSVGPIVFTVGDVETSADDLTLTVDSTNDGLLPTNNIVFSGSGSNRTVTFTPLPDQFGVSGITLTVTDGDGGARNTSFLFTVNPVNDQPSFTAIPDQTNEEDIVIGPILLTVGDVETAASNLLFSVESTNTILLPTNNIVVGGSGTNRTLTLTPATNHYGASFITLTVADADGGSNSVAFALTVNAVNDLPTLSPINNQTTNEDEVVGPLAFSVEDAETAATNLTITADSSNPVLLPVASIHLTGSDTNRFITLSPVTNQFGSATVTLTVTDGDGGTNTTAFVLAISPVNDLPVISDVSDQVADEDAVIGPLALTIDDLETAADSLLITCVSTNPALLPTNNIVFAGAGINRTATLTPVSNQSGSTLITVTITDGEGGVASDSFQVTVNPVNDAPLISGIAGQSNNLNTVIGPIAFTLGDEETSLDSLLISVDSTNPVLLPTNNIVLGGSGPNRTLTLTPATDQFGFTEITLTVTDGDGATNSTSFVVAVNALPTISLISNQATNEDQVVGPIEFSVGDLDTPAENLVLSADSTNSFLLPTNAIVFGGSATNRTITLSPATNQFGSTLITVQVSDGAGGAASAAFVLSVQPVNDPPIANDDLEIAQEDLSLLLDPLSNDSDADGDILLITGVASTNGTINILGGTNLLFLPDTNFHGVASITYTNNDGSGSEATAVILVMVTPVNDLPIASDDFAATPEDVSLTLDPLANDADADGDALTILGATATNGIVNIIGGTNLFFTPTTNFHGAASVTYTNSDGNGGEAPAVISVTVTPVNDLPEASDDFAATPEDVSLTLDPLANDTDVDGDALMILGATFTNGTVTILGGTNLFFTPATNFNGTASITYTNSDGSGGEAAATISVTITPVNDSPIANPDLSTTPEDTALILDSLVNDTDVDGDALTIQGAASTNGTVTILGGTNLVFLPATNFNGTTSISYTSSDGQGGTAAGLFSVTVSPVNDQPVALNGFRFVPEDQPTLLEPLANDFDPDGDPLTVTAAISTNGSVNILGGTNLLYLPETNYLGILWVAYTISDGQGGTASAGVNLAVVHVNAAPVANDDLAGTLEDTPVALTPLANDTDEEDGQPTVVLATASIGVVTNLDGTNLVFTPPTNFNGLVSLSYTVADSAGRTDSASIAVTVIPVSDPPVVGDDFVETCLNFTVNIPVATVLANDQNVDGSGTLSITNFSPSSAAGGTVLFAAGDFTFSPLTNFTGLDTFTYTVVDPEGDEATGTVMVWVGTPLYFMSIAAQTNGAMFLRVCGHQGSNYVMQATSDFINWTNLGGLSDGGLGGLQFEDNGTAGVNARFYRVQLP